MKKKTLSILLILLLILGVGVRFAYRYKRLYDRDKQDKMVEQAQVINQTTPAEKNRERLQSILDGFQNRKEANADYDKVLAVDAVYGLGIKGDAYYIVDQKSGKDILLESVSKAYVLPITDAGQKVTFKGVFGFKSGGWYFFTKSGEGIVEIKGADLTEQSHLVLEDGRFSVAD